MRKLGLAIAIIVTLTPLAAHAGKPCARRKFETKLVGDACKKDQEAAKTAMKDFLKTVNQGKGMHDRVGCPSCHAKVGGDYPLKPTGLKTFKDLGGA